MKKSNIILASILGLVLTSALVYYNFIDKTKTAEKGGSEVGDKCLNQDIKLINGEEGTWSVKDNLGKVCVINFWYITCTGCINELPGFDETYKSYSPDNVSFIAIHQKNWDENEVNYYVQNRDGWEDFSIHFGMDDSKNEYYTSLGGKKAWPMTLIIDKEGVIAYKKQGELAKEVLKEQVDLLVNK